jgi:predicted DCC family thiol-disulfide oxidoreductase YuxK
MGSNSILDPDKPIIFFDSNCLLCSRFVRFLLKVERRQFYYSGFESSVALEILPSNIRTNPNTVAFYFNGNLNFKSKAVFMIIRELKYPWRVFGIFNLLPTTLNDSIYSFISRNRTSWFGRSDQCFVASTEQKDRFIE